MPATPSTMAPLGSACPDFRLLDVTTGRTVARDDFAKAPALLVMFICNHCPFVKHMRSELARLPQDFAARGLATVAICPNDAIAYPADGPDAMRLEAVDAGYRFPYLHDETQDVARAFAAACTPDFFLYDRARKLAYRGQLDDSRPNSGVPVDGRDLRAAVEALLSGAAPTAAQKPSIGCNIKWRAAANAGA